METWFRSQIKNEQKTKSAFEKDIFEKKAKKLVSRDVYFLITGELQALNSLFLSKFLSYTVYLSYITFIFQ